MIDEKKLREKLRDIWLRHPPYTPESFGEANQKIDEIIEDSEAEEETKETGETEETKETEEKPATVPD